MSGELDGRVGEGKMVDMYLWAKSTSYVRMKAWAELRLSL